MLASAPESVEELTSGTSYSPPPAFGRFKLLHQIGAGVLGPVFRTHDPDHEHLVAVKAFTLDLTPEQASVLAAEFSRLAGLEFDSPCVAGPVAAGVEDFVPYSAAPYVSGESLDAAIRQYGPAPAGDAIRLIGHVAEALDAAARLGVFHGSLHPRDIIVTPGETHVTGFGIAQALGRVGLPRRVGLGGRRII
jgi:serine/threonine protein kinase